MNFIMLIVGTSLFIWGYMENKKMRNNFKDVYDEVIKSQSEEKQISSEDEKYNIIEEIKRLKGKDELYKEIGPLLNKYEEDEFIEEIAKEADINKGELLLLKNIYKE